MPAEACHRQRVEHFVGEHDPVEGNLRRRVQPFHAPRKMRHGVGDAAALALAQIGADLEHQVALGKTAEGLQPQQDIRRQTAAARADLEDAAASERAQDFGALAGNAAAEQPRDFRRRGEIAPGPELVSTGAVVAEPRCIERELHVAVEADPAACRVDLRRDSLAHPLDVRALGHIELRRRPHRRALRAPVHAAGAIRYLDLAWPTAPRILSTTK